MAVRGHIRSIEIRKDRLIQDNFTQIYDGFTGVTKLIRGPKHFEAHKAKKPPDYDPFQESLKDKFGHIFQVKINIDFTFDKQGDEGGASGCCLEWWERPTQPYERLQKDTWNQLYEVDVEGDRPTNSIFENWFKTNNKVEKAGEAIVKILDRPNLNIFRDKKKEKLAEAKIKVLDRSNFGIEGKDKKRILYFCIVAKCTPGCEQCKEGYKVATAIQGLSIDWAEQKNYFFHAYRPDAFVSYNGKEPYNLNPPALIIEYFG